MPTVEYTFYSILFFGGIIVYLFLISKHMKTIDRTKWEK